MPDANLDTPENVTLADETITFLFHMFKCGVTLTQYTCISVLVLTVLKMAI
jgi:hypothetical protein